MRGGRRPWALSLSLLAHAGLLAAVLTAVPAPHRYEAPDALPVEVVAPRVLPEPKPPQPAPERKAKAEAAPAKPVPPRPPPALAAREARAPAPDVAPLRIAVAREAAASDEVSDAELAGAAQAGAGGGAGDGAGCDMAAWLQGRLRRDARVQAAMTAARPERPLMVWNGAWVRHGAEEGAGLAQVRESIMWEVGFAPAACRSQAVRGLVVLSLADAPGAPRLVLGRASWRWSDLLFARGAGAG
jgi:hypothetical protein